LVLAEDTCNERGTLIWCIELEHWVLIMKVVGLTTLTQVIVLANGALVAGTNDRLRRATITFNIGVNRETIIPFISPFFCLRVDHWWLVGHEVSGLYFLDLFGLLRSYSVRCVIINNVFKLNNLVNGLVNLRRFILVLSFLNLRLVRNFLFSWLSAMKHIRLRHKITSSILDISVTSNKRRLRQFHIKSHVHKLLNGFWKVFRWARGDRGGLYLGLIISQWETS
jgi:hypothetical protein